MKLMLNICWVFVVLCGVFQLAFGEILNCEFTDEFFYTRSLYSCKVSSLDNTKNTMVITEYSGTHKTNKNVNNVQLILIENTNTKYIPINLGILFNLTELFLFNTQLVEIKSQDFTGMENLNELNLRENNLTCIPIDAFTSLTKIKEINLSKNQLEEIPNGVFSKNLQLERIQLYVNKIKFLGSNLFDGLTKLDYAVFFKNICIDGYYKGSTKITQLKDIIKIQCKNPIESIQCTTITTQNPAMQIKIKEFEQELLQQQQKNAIEMAKVQQELRAAKSEQQKEHDEVTRLERKNADLSAKLSIALDDQQLQQEDMTKLNGTNSKLVQEIFKLNKEISTSNDLQKSQQTIMMESVSEVFSLNKQRRLDQLTIDNLKQELSDAKEELKKNSIEFESNQKELMNNFTLLNQKDRKESTELLTICESKNQELLKLNSFTMNCDYTDTDGAYTCVSNQLPINNRNMKLNTVIGTHLNHKSNGDVTKLIITNTTTLFWTNDIFTTFPVLQILRIHNAKLQEFSNGDFSSATNLKSLDIQGNDMKSLGDEIFTGGTELEVIKMESNGIKKVGEKTFHGLTKLKFLSLKNNLIIDLHLDTFKDAGMLEHLILTQNKIQSLNGGLLKFNLELRTLTVDGNEVKEIGDELLDSSVALELVNFSGNFCVDGDLEEWEIQEVKFVIKHCCKKPEEGVKRVYNCGHRGWSN